MFCAKKTTNVFLYYEIWKHANFTLKITAPTSRMYSLHSEPYDSPWSVLFFAPWQSHFNNL